MTVSELIAYLQTFPPETEVMLYSTDGMDGRVDPISAIEVQLQTVRHTQLVPAFPFPEVRDAGRDRPRPQNVGPLNAIVEDRPAVVIGR